MPAGTNKPMGGLEWLLLITLSILWGGSFFFGKLALAEIPPFSVVLVRVGFAAAALHVVLIATGGRLPRSLRLWGAFLVMGLLNNMIPFSLIFWGQTQISSSLASILNATTPLLVRTNRWVVWNGCCSSPYPSCGAVHSSSEN